VNDRHLRQASRNQDCSRAAHAINDSGVINRIDLIEGFGGQGHCLVEYDVLAVYTWPNLDNIACIGCIKCSLDGGIIIRDS
jgi:hypothetical protein